MRKLKFHGTTVYWCAELEHCHQVENVTRIDNFGEDADKIVRRKDTLGMAGNVGGEEGSNYMGAQPIGRQHNVVNFGEFVTEVHNFTDHYKKDIQFKIIIVK